MMGSKNQRSIAIIIQANTNTNDEIIAKKPIKMKMAILNSSFVSKTACRKNGFLVCLISFFIIIPFVNIRFLCVLM